MTYQSIINENEFENLLKEYNFKVVKEICVFETARSLLLLKEK